MLFKNKEKSIT